MGTALPVILHSRQRKQLAAELATALSKDATNSLYHQMAQMMAAADVAKPSRSSSASGKGAATTSSPASGRVAKLSGGKTTPQSLQPPKGRVASPMSDTAPPPALPPHALPLAVAAVHAWGVFVQILGSAFLEVSGLGTFRLGRLSYPCYTHNDHVAMATSYHGISHTYIV